jgi:hypothetical protein
MLSTLKIRSMSTSIADNTLENYIAKCIDQMFATYTSGNKYDKLYRDLLSRVEEIIKLTISEARHCDTTIENVYNDPRFNKKLIHVIGKQQISRFLEAHPIKKEAIAEFYNEYHMNESDLKHLREAEDIANKINNVSLLQQNEKNEELNIRKILAQSIKIPSPEKYKSGHFSS